MCFIYILCCLFRGSSTATTAASTAALVSYAWCCSCLFLSTNSPAFSLLFCLFSCYPILVLLNPLEEGQWQQACEIAYDHCCCGCISESRCSDENSSVLVYKLSSDVSGVSNAQRMSVLLRMMTPIIATVTITLPYTTAAQVRL
jgi:hypothetical protein